jgi:hypothetical protein
MIFPLTVVRSAGLPFSALESPVFDLPAVESAWHRAKEHLHELGMAWPAIFKQALAAMPDSARRTTLYNFSRKVRRQVASGQFVPIAYPDRAEAPPVELVHAIAQWNAAIAAEQQGKHRFEVLYFETLTDEIKRLQHLAAGETLQGALLFTSHDLLQQLPAWTQKAVSDFDKKDRRMARAVWQYAARATYKTTPRSRLATVGVVDAAKVATDEASPWMDGEEWGLSAGKKNTSKITPNAALLPLLYDALLKAPAFYHTLKITLNPCIHQSESTNYEWLYYNGAQESFQQAEAGEALNFIANTLLSAPAPYTFTGLLALLTTATDNPQESEILLFHLADTGFLEWVWPENGLSSNWCSSLYQYLGYLPALPVIADAAQVLQWLKTAARTLPFQSVPQARTTIAEAADLLNGFLQRYGVDCPPIAPEQVFYEDVAHHQPPLPCADALQKWAEQLSLLVQDAATTPAKAVLHGHGALEHAKVAQFLRDHYPDNDPVSFSDFSKKYTGVFDNKKNFTQLKLSYQFKNPNTKANPIKTGALLQVFQENGQQKAVLNALYPGGGKLLSRWLHLFDAQYSRVVAQWNAEPHLAAFPWQHPAIGCHNCLASHRSPGQICLSGTISRPVSYMTAKQATRFSLQISVWMRQIQSLRSCGFYGLRGVVFPLSAFRIPLKPCLKG